jgi:hypothetical protein
VQHDQIALDAGAGAQGAVAEHHHHIPFDLVPSTIRSPRITLRSVATTSSADTVTSVNSLRVDSPLADRSQRESKTQNHQHPLHGCSSIHYQR